MSLRGSGVEVPSGFESGTYMGRDEKRKPKCCRLPKILENRDKVLVPGFRVQKNRPIAFTFQWLAAKRHFDEKYRHHRTSTDSNPLRRSDSVRLAGPNIVFPSCRDMSPTFPSSDHHAGSSAMYARVINSHGIARTHIAAQQSPCFDMNFPIVPGGKF